MGGVFVSYRRDDAKHAAGRLVDRLVGGIGRDRIFMDVDNIEPGLDFVRVLGDSVAACDAMLVLIGPNWLDSRDARGQRRLDSTSDFVRIEIEAALNRDIRVIPVLLDGAEMPQDVELPDGLKPLARRQGVRITHERFAAETDALTAALRRLLGLDEQRTPPQPQPQPQPPPPMTAAPAEPPKPVRGGAIVLSEAELAQIANQAKNPSIFVAPDIPPHKLANARSTAAVPIDEPVIVLVDGTTFGSAKNCLVATPRGVYYHNGGASWSVPYRRLRDMNSAGSLLGYKVKLDATHVIDFSSQHTGMTVGSFVRNLVGHLQRYE